MAALAACNSTSKEAENNNGTDTVFVSFTNRYAMASLPLSFKGCDQQPLQFKATDLGTYHRFLSEDAGLLSYCTFKANGNYIAVITLAEADCLVPVLSTYTKDGKKIDEKEISIGSCGPDCDFTCSEYMIINSDYSIYTSDTITYRQCDSLNEPIRATREHYVLYRTGRLLPTGKIELTKETKLMLKD